MMKRWRSCTNHMLASWRAPRRAKAVSVFAAIRKKREIPAGPLFAVTGRYSTPSRKVRPIALAKKE